MTDFYPQGYQPKETPSDYMKLEEGENRIRILTSPIIGFEFWHEDSEGRHPVRIKNFIEALKDERASDGVKEFHAFIVWDYKAESVRLLNVTQKSIQRAIFSYASDEDWGSPTGYDILITRVGKGLETEYSVIAKPAKPLEEAISEAFKAVKIVPEEYFASGHPISREKTETGHPEFDESKMVGNEDDDAQTIADQIPF